MTAKTLLFGGSFDPVHCGHLIVSRAAAEAMEARRVLLVPAAANPLKDGPHASGADRMAMLNAAVADDELFDVCDVELHRPPPSYTIDTVEALGEGELALLVGVDSLAEFAKWHRVGDLVRRVEVCVACRPPDGPEQVERRIEQLREELGQSGRGLRARPVVTPQIEISSTDLRARVGQGRPIRYCVPQVVAEYIRARGLYRSAGGA
jgi:nicotinate-nucleotide adenylyltransferase